MIILLQFVLFYPILGFSDQLDVDSVGYRWEWVKMNAKFVISTKKYSKYIFNFVTFILLLLYIHFTVQLHIRKSFRVQNFVTKLILRFASQRKTRPATSSIKRLPLLQDALCHLEIFPAKTQTFHSRVFKPR